MTDFAGSINKEKGHGIYILTCIDRFSKYPSAEIFDNANASNVIKFLDNCIQNHGVRLQFVYSEFVYNYLKI